MNVFTNTKTTKKILIALVILMLFNFSCPSVVRAGDALDYIMIGVGELFFGLFNGVQKLINDIFIDKDLYDIGGGAIPGARTNKIDADITVSAENIISGKFLLFEPNIFKKIVSSDEDVYLDYKIITEKGGRDNLRGLIASWYYALRNFAIIALLSVLVYVAIRMILTTIAQDKAKYKTMFKDWLIAICLLFIIHYLMVGILELTSTITQSIGTRRGSIGSGVEAGIESKLDLALELTRDGGTNDKEVIDLVLTAMADTVLYAAIVIMNIIFIVKYAIRSVTIIFLVLLAPISCITYPIDKISDGKAQAYDTWFKEFLYQVIIQPFHLVIYIVLISSAAKLASSNLIYAMICFGVMIPAEKFIKQMFGFKDKLGSPLGAFAGGAIAGQLMNSMKSLGKSSGGGKDTESNKADNLPPNTKNINLPGTDGSDDGGVTRRGADTPSYGLEDQKPQTATNQLDETQSQEPQTATNQLDETQSQEPQIEGNSTATLKNDTSNVTGENVNKTGEDSKGLKEKIRDNKVVQFGKKAYDKVTGTKAANAAKARLSRNVMRKYGSTDIKTVAGRMTQRGLSKAYKGAKNTGRKLIKGAATLTGAAALGAFGAMFGQGKEMAMVGAGLGGRLGNAVTNKTDKIAGTVEGYTGEIWDAYKDRAERKDKREFKENEKNIKQARLNYRERHDGKDPIGKELDNELEKMYLMDSHGVKPDQYNDVLSDYKEYVNPEGPYKYSEEEAMDTAMTSALMAQNYSQKDLRDKKSVEGIYNDYMDRYEAAGVDQTLADKKVRELISGAAKMKGADNVPLPPPRKQEVTKDVETGRKLPKVKAEQLGVSSANGYTNKDVVRMNQLTLTLEEKGYTPKQISDAVGTIVPSQPVKDASQRIRVIDNYETEVKFLADDNARDYAKNYIAATKGIKPEEVSEKDVNVEMVARLGLFKVDVQPSSMNRLREIEENMPSTEGKTMDEIVKTETADQRALRITKGYSKSDMQKPEIMDKGIAKEAKLLVKNGKVPPGGDGRKEAVAAFEEAASYKGTEVQYTENSI